MTVWKDGRLFEDRWRILEDAAPLGDSEALVSLKRWRTERATLLARNAPLGIVISPGEEWDDLAADLARFPVIAVTVPKYGDGRAFSIARLLRERDGYKGEIRAIGDFILDQMPLMRRVGIDAFDIKHEATRQGLERGLWPEVPQYLQPVEADTAREKPAGKRPWARRRSDGVKR
ncbi:MAG: DUF934 domain-containing protein [Bauldia sp.]